MLIRQMCVGRPCSTFGDQIGAFLKKEKVSKYPERTIYRLLTNL